jgi:hypothetical protein
VGMMDQDSMMGIMKLDEIQRDWHKHGDRDPNIGDGVEWFNKDSKRWDEPMLVEGCKDLHHGREWIVERNGEWMRATPAHIRKQIKLDEMIFPPVLLGVVNKTHEKVMSAETRKINIKIPRIEENRKMAELRAEMAKQRKVNKTKKRGRR